MLKYIKKQVVEMTKRVGVKAINSDCNIYFYNEPVPKTLKKYKRK